MPLIPNHEIMHRKQERSISIILKMGMGNTLPESKGIICNYKDNMCKTMINGPCVSPAYAPSVKSQWLRIARHRLSRKPPLLGGTRGLFPHSSPTPLWTEKLKLLENSGVRSRYVKFGIKNAPKAGIQWGFSSLFCMWDGVAFPLLHLGTTWDRQPVWRNGMLRSLHEVLVWKWLAQSHPWATCRSQEESLPPSFLPRFLSFFQSSSQQIKDK